MDPEPSPAGAAAPQTEPDPGWPNVGPPPPLNLQTGYRLALVVEPDGRVRSIVEASGISMPAPDALRGQTLMEMSARREGGPERGAMWGRRLAIAREATEVMHYADPAPGAEPGAEPTVDCRVTPIRTADGTLEAILVEIDDRTAIQQTERRLAEGEQRFRKLAEALPQMVWISEPEYGGVYFSPRWETFTGRSIDELLGKGYLDLIHPDDLTVLDAARAAGDSPLPVQFRLRHHDGTYRWVESYVNFLRDKDGAVVTAVGGTTDITARREEEELRIRSQKREEVGTLAAGLAHDFNNVIGAILSNASLAQTEIAAGASPATSVAEIAQAAVRAADLVRRMLAYSREDEPTRCNISVDELVGEACDLLGATLPPGIDLVRTIASPLPEVSGDASQLHQVVMNLVKNARQAIRDTTGTINVLVDRVSLPGPFPGASELPDGEYVRLRVRDTGAGMPEAIQLRAFDPFFTTKPAGEGTGLGLAAARTILHQHGGNIGVESAEGAGTTFTVLLAALEAEPHASDDHNPEPSPLVATPRVAFVDDEVALATLADRAMSLYGCEPVVFTDPAAALEAFRETPGAFDALITDHAMPGLTGLELIRAVRALRPNLPVILTSGFLTASHREEAERHGVDAIVPKPCSIEQLASVTKGLLGVDAGA